MGLSVKYAFLLIFIFGFAVHLIGQQEAELVEIQEYSSNILGTSPFLVNGWKYQPEHFNAAGNPHFNDTEWHKGSVTRGKEKFENLVLGYNLQMGAVILKQALKDGQTAYIMLNNDFIDSFTIDQHHFINTGKVLPLAKMTGFAELIYSGDFLLIITHKKSFVGKYSASTPNGSFSRQQSGIFLLKDDVLNKITSKKSLVSLFPGHTKKINAFISKHKIRLKSAGNSQLEQLMEY